MSEGSTYLHALPFCCRDLDINHMTLKLVGDLDILNMYLHTENELAILRHSTLLKQGCSPKKEVGGRLKQDLDTATRV